MIIPTDYLEGYEKDRKADSDLADKIHSAYAHLETL